MKTTAPASETGDATTRAPAETPRERAKRRASSALSYVAAIAIFFGIRAYVQRGVVTGVAPALTGRDLDGRVVSLADSRGHAVMVHFWGTWCPVCRAEIGNVDALAHGRPVITVASSSGDATKLRAYLAEHGLTMQVVVDDDDRLARAWGVRSFPTSFFLDAGQRIRFTETGYTTSPGLWARSWLAGVLGG